MFDWLKTILGDVYTEEIDKKVAAEIGKGFVSKMDFNTANTAKKQLEEDLKGRDRQLDELKKADPAKLQEEIDRLKGENKTAGESYQKELAKLQKQGALRAELAGKAHDPDDVLALLDLEKIELTQEGKLREPVDGLVREIRSKKPYLFAEEAAKPPVLHGSKPAEPPGAGGGGGDELALWRAEAGLETIKQ